MQSSDSEVQAGAPSLSHRFAEVRGQTRRLVSALSAEDAVVQSMTDASPTKWHLAHTTWFFETFVFPELGLERVSDPIYAHLFNSYYNTVGTMHERPQRGLLTRPSLQDVTHYRGRLDEALGAALARGVPPEVAGLVELGLQHEQQHQELILMDIQHLLSRNPLRPNFQAGDAVPCPRWPTDTWVRVEGGVYSVGHAGEGFAYDNEGPQHDVLLGSFEMAQAPVTCGEYLEFVRDGGYARPELWLSDGWATVQREGWDAPLYWTLPTNASETPTVFGLRGEQAMDPTRPVCSLSYYEADAYASYRGARLPSEQEWEVAAKGRGPDANWLETGELLPSLPAREASTGAVGMLGGVWEWTRSAYSPYPGYRPPAGALGEYNGKFMANQVVLRGGCCVSPRGHVRPSYRNFYYPHQRWMFSGLRLARDA